MKPQTRDNLIYLAVGLGVAALVTIDIYYAESRGREMWTPSLFTFRAVYSTGLLGYFVARETRKVKATVVHVLLCVVCASILHLAIACGSRHSIGELPGLIFAALAVPEMYLIVQLMVKAAEYLRPRRRSA